MIYQSDDPNKFSNTIHRIWALQVSWDDGGFYFGQPFKHMGLEIDEDKMAEKRGKIDLFVDAETLGQAMKEACDYVEETLHHSVWDIWVLP